ncbi:MAG: DUF327 family protein, partial [Peptococcaceae bacterium]|nr:DUF327 family protein [Peptococcaceae bacterium]
TPLKFPLPPVPRPLPKLQGVLHLSLRIDQATSIRANKNQPVNFTPKVESFRQELTNIQNTSSAEIDVLAKNVEAAGVTLAGQTSLANLENYKSALQKLLQKVAQNYGLNSEQILNSRGQHRILIAIHKIEATLNDLSAELTAKNVNNVKVLTKIDTIKGLLVDLFT